MSKRIYTYYNEAVQLRNGKICNPRMAIIYPVYGCNLTCEGCLCNRYNDDITYMPAELFEKLCNDLNSMNVKSIEFCGGGEPLLHPNIDEIISIVPKNMSLGMMSNGSLLNENLMQLIVERFKYVRLSIYEENCSIAIENLQKMLTYKKSCFSDIKIGAKFLASKKNQDFIIDALNNFSNLPPDLISIKCERNSLNELSSKEMDDLYEQLKEFKYPNMSFELKKTHLNEKCWLSPIHTLIDAKGDVYLCCYYMDREDQHRIGNVNYNSFEKIWQSEDHKNKLKNIDKDKCNVYDCRWHRYNVELSNLFLTNEIQHEFC